MEYSVAVEWGRLEDAENTWKVFFTFEMHCCLTNVLIYGHRYYERNCWVFVTLLKVIFLHYNYQFKSYLFLYHSNVPVVCSWGCTMSFITIVAIQDLWHCSTVIYICYNSGPWQYCCSCMIHICCSTYTYLELVNNFNLNFSFGITFFSGFSTLVGNFIAKCVCPISLLHKTCIWSHWKGNV